MKKRKHKLFRKWDYVIWVMIIITGFLYYHITLKRVEYGFFETSKWIFLSDFLNIIFFGLVTGYLIAKIVQKTRR